MPYQPLRVVAHLGSMLCGEAPMLEEMLASVASRLRGKDGVDPGFKVDRRSAVPDSTAVPIPLRRQDAAGHLIAMSTSPILDKATAETVDHLSKQLAVHHSQLLDASDRRIVTTTNGWTKGYRLPLRCRRIPRVAWLCIGERREVLKLLKEVPAIGRKRSHGYGRVASWECDRLDFAPTDCWPWWMPSEAGPVLMRPMPTAFRRLPANLLGAKPDFGACSGVSWHPENYVEVVVPC